MSQPRARRGPSSRASRAVVMAASLLLVTLASTRQARACGRGMGGFSLTSGEVAAALGIGLAAGAVVVSDVAFTIHDVSHAGTMKEHSQTWAKVETYVTLPQVAFGAMMPLIFRDGDAFTTAVAFTSWPAAMMMHGFYVTNGDYGQRWQLPVAVLGVLDATMLGYDFGAAVSGRRPNEGYVMGELITGLAQTSFGLVYASESEGTASRDALLFSAVPFALTAHALLVMAIPRSHHAPPPPPPPMKTTGSTTGLRLHPLTMLPGPRGPVPALGVQGVF